MQRKKTAFSQFLVWRYKYLSDKNFLYILSVIVGLLAGGSTVVLKNLTHFIAAILEDGSLASYHHYFYFIFPFIGLLLVVLVKKYFLQEEVSHGIPLALHAISQKSGKMNRKDMIGSILTAPLTVGFGGSVGLEGPSVATGASIGSNFAQLFHVKVQTRKLLLICAAAASLSAIFKAPIAAILFAIEVFSLDLTLASLLPLLLASVSAVITRIFFIGEQYLVPVSGFQLFEISNVLFYAALGIVSALISIYFTKVYFVAQDYFTTVKNDYLKITVAGIVLGALVFIVPPLYGEGFSFMNNLVSQNYAIAFDDFLFQEWLSNPWIIIALLLGLMLLKPIATATTLGCGGVGGIFAPSLFLGAATGSFFVHFFNEFGANLPTANFTMIGMAGVLAAVLHAPLTAMFLIAEITGGYELFIPLMITVSISFLIGKAGMKYTIYTKELIEKNELITHDKDRAVLMLLQLERIVEQNFIQLKPEMTLKEMLYGAVVKSKRNLFPVTNDENELVGIITLDDIREIMFNTSLHDAVLVKFLMHDPPDFIDFEEDRMQHVMDKFQNTGAWNLPVIKNGKYYGFISKSKLLTAYRQELRNY